MRPRTIGILQARLASTRLPAKILAPLADRPLLALLVARLAPAHVDEWWLATTVRRDDDVTGTWGEALGLRVLRGDSDDVLARFGAIVADRRPEWVVRVTADDPFTDAGIVNHLLAATPSCDAALVEAAGGVLPLGYAPQIARGDAILAAAREAHASFHRAHVLTWVSEHGKSHAVPLPESWPVRPRWRWTIDTAEDLAMARAAFACFGADAASIGYPEMVRVLDAHPEIAARNAHVRQKSIEEG
jgi:spore coat polysaccharide biosynthesis protein SpsF (cytidylyltransferase family)